MDDKVVLYLCMGSACHQRGVYQVLPALQKLMGEHSPDTEVELKGAFCLENCMRGIVIKVGEETITDITPENLETKFAGEILPVLKNRNQG
jgi:NADH:ubiquinone oxidoreductase subunit E